MYKIFIIFLMILFAHLFLPSEVCDAKNKKIFHGLIRTTLYLVAIYFFFTLKFYYIEQLASYIFGFFLIFIMLKVNWISYKRHKKWIYIKAKTSNRNNYSRKE